MEEEEERRIVALSSVGPQCSERGIPFVWIHPDDSLVWKVARLRELMEEVDASTMRTVVRGFRKRSAWPSKHRVLSNDRSIAKELAASSLPGRDTWTTH